MGISPARMSVYHMCAWCSRRPEESIGSPGTRVTHNCELPHKCWDFNLDPLEEQPFLQPLHPALRQGLT